MPKENNNMQVDIENLFKQNVNDLSSIKELYRKLKEVEKKITEIKYTDTVLVNKLKKDYESLIKTISKDYESLKCIILDENIQAKLANDIKTINSQLDNKVKIIDNMISLEACKIDGEEDYSNAFIRALEISKREKVKIIGSGVYKLNTLVEFDCEESEINIEISGYITPAGSGLHLKNINSGNILINIKNGGVDENNFGIRLDGKGVKAEINGDNYKGTVFLNRSLWCSNVSVNAKKGCGRAVYHAPSDEVKGYLQAFGTYQYIYDFNSKFATKFIRSGDITIMHYENHYTGNDANSLVFDHCGAIHLINVCIGGICTDALMMVNGTTGMTIYNLYCMGEDKKEKITCGISMNQCYIYCHYSRFVSLKNNIISNDESVGRYNFKIISSNNCENVILKNGNVLKGYLTTRLTSYNPTKTIIPTNYIGKDSNGNVIEYFYDDVNNLGYKVGVKDNNFTVNAIAQSNDNGTPFLVSSTGRVNIGKEGGTLGFFGNFGSTQPTINSNLEYTATTENIVDRINSINNALAMLGLVKRR